MEGTQGRMLQKRPQSLSALSCSRVERAHICIFIVNNENVEGEQY